MTGLQLMGLSEYIPQDIKKQHKMCQKIVFIILATAVSVLPTPEVCFSQGRLRRTILPKKRYSDSLSGCG